MIITQLKTLSIISMFKNLFVLLVLTIPSYIFSGPQIQTSATFDHPLIISELIDIALKNHPSTHKTWWNATRAAAVLGLAESSYYPKVGAEARANHGRTFKFVNGPDTTYTIVGADLTLGMLLYDFGERNARVEAAKMALQAADWQTDWNIQKVMMTVLENTYTVLHAQEVVQSAIFSFEDAEKLLTVAQELNRAGISPISDVYTSLAILAQMKMELSMQKALLDIQKGKLASSLGISATTCFHVAPLQPVQPQQLKQTDELIALAYEQRTDLMAKQAQLSESLFNQDKIKASYGPKIFLGARGGPNYAFQEKEQGAQYQIALNFEMPLFNGFETTYQNRMAYADTHLSMEDLATLQLDIILEVLTYNRTLEATQEMLIDAESNFTNSLKAYESVLQRYQAGIERIAEVSNAQRQLAVARVRYSEVKTRWFVSMANLAYATGTLRT